MAVSLGFASDAIVQEFYVDDDVDQAVREAIEGETGHPLVDVDYADVVDGAIVWWRADDAEEEDLADVLVDAMSNLDDGGLIWVLIPKPGRPNSVRVGDVEEAAEIAGLHATTSTALGAELGGRAPDRASAFAPLVLLTRPGRRQRCPCAVSLGLGCDRTRLFW